MLVTPGCCDCSVLDFKHAAPAFLGGRIELAACKTLARERLVPNCHCGFLTSYTYSYGRTRTALLCCCIDTDVSKVYNPTQAPRSPPSLWLLQRWSSPASKKGHRRGEAAPHRARRPTAAASRRGAGRRRRAPRSRRRPRLRVQSSRRTTRAARSPPCRRMRSETRSTTCARR